MLKYKKIFLNKIKLLLSYFIKFSDNKSMLLKIYLENYTIDGPNQKPFIMIIYDKSIFFTNNG